MGTLLLVRHGETDWNRSGQIMGEQPVPLNEVGEAQARALAEVLSSRPISTIYSSPVKRATQTADILARYTGAQVALDRGLTEINVGEWVGRFWSELRDDIVKQDFYVNPAQARPPGGETLQEVQARAVSLVERVVSERDEEEHDPAPLVFVSHADVVRAIAAHYLRLDLQIVRQVRVDHASLTGLELRDGLVTLLFLNYRPEPPGLE